MVASGAAIGIVSALVVLRWVRSQLFGVRPTDPLTLMTVTSTVIVVALLATWHPARQAARVDPRELVEGLTEARDAARRGSARIPINAASTTTPRCTWPSASGILTP